MYIVQFYIKRLGIPVMNFDGKGNCLSFHLNVYKELRGVEFCYDGNPGDADGNQDDNEGPAHQQ